MSEPTTVNILLGQIALIAVMATLRLAWSLCEGYLEYRRQMEGTSGLICSAAPLVKPWLRPGAASRQATNARSM